MHLTYLRTTKQVSKMLECTTRNVALLVKNKKINPIKILENGSFLFNVKDVEYYLQNRSNHE
jgi:hypothetical protein